MGNEPDSVAFEGLGESSEKRIENETHTRTADNVIERGVNIGPNARLDWYLRNEETVSAQPATLN